METKPKTVDSPRTAPEGQEKQELDVLINAELLEAKFADIVICQSTPEIVTLLFGRTQAVEGKKRVVPAVTVAIAWPLAKRLADMLARQVKEQSQDVLRHYAEQLAGPERRP